MRNNKIDTLIINAALYCILTAAFFITNIITDDILFIYLTVVMNAVMILSMMMVLLYVDDAKMPLPIKLLSFILIIPLLILSIVVSYTIDMFRKLFVIEEGGDDYE